ncbi:MAG: hypothetical protein ACEY3J_00510 [Arsenophonus sp.]
MLYQSEVSQQIQSLEQLVCSEFFERHGRNKLLKNNGFQLLVSMRGKYYVLMIMLWLH